MRAALQVAKDIDVDGSLVMPNQDCPCRADNDTGSNAEHRNALPDFGDGLSLPGGSERRVSGERERELGQARDQITVSYGTGEITGIFVRLGVLLLEASSESHQVPVRRGRTKSAWGRRLRRPNGHRKPDLQHSFTSLPFPGSICGTALRPKEPVPPSPAGSVSGASLLPAALEGEKPNRTIPVARRTSSLAQGVDQHGSALERIDWGLGLVGGVGRLGCRVLVLGSNQLQDFSGFGGFGDSRGRL